MSLDLKKYIEKTLEGDIEAVLAAKHTKPSLH